jgi:thiamine kinase-like enzyme
MTGIRIPFTNNIRATKNDWTRPNSDVDRLIRDTLGAPNNSNVSELNASRHSGIPGFYRISTDEIYFIKIVSKENCKNQLIADRISKLLKNEGLNTITTKNHSPIKIVGTNYYIFLYDYYNFKYLSYRVKYLRKLGHEIGKLHSLLKQLPCSFNAQRVGLKHNKLILTRYREIINNEIPTRSSREMKVLKNFDFNDYKLIHMHPQMIHGDLNHGNILINNENEKLYIIDFEDSMKSWLSPMYDIAFVIQRFVLTAKKYDWEELMTAFVTSYRTQVDIPCFNREDILEVFLKLISVRSLLILHISQLEVDFPFQNELNKFVYLYKFTDENSQLINKVYKRAIHA